MDSQPAEVTAITDLEGSDMDCSSSSHGETNAPPVPGMIVHLADSVPHYKEVELLYNELHEKHGMRVKMHAHGPQERSVCGYRAVVSAFVFAMGCFLNLDIGMVQCLTDDIICKFFHHILDDHKSKEAVWLSDLEIEKIVCCINFLQENFHLSCISSARLLYRNLAAIEEAVSIAQSFFMEKNAFCSMDPSKQPSDMTDDFWKNWDKLIRMIDEVRRKAKPIDEPNSLKGLLKKVSEEMLACKSTGGFVTEYCQALLTQCCEFISRHKIMDEPPTWFLGVFGFDEFLHHIEQIIHTTDRPLVSGGKVAVVNVKGVHWITVAYKNVEEEKKSAQISKATGSCRGVIV